MRFRHRPAMAGLGGRVDEKIFRVDDPRPADSIAGDTDGHGRTSRCGSVPDSTLRLVRGKSINISFPHRTRKPLTTWWLALLLSSSRKAHHKNHEYCDLPEPPEAVIANEKATWRNKINGNKCSHPPGRPRRPGAFPRPASWAHTLVHRCGERFPANWPPRAWIKSGLGHRAEFV
jgi:hypothetical protein